MKLLRKTNSWLFKIQQLSNQINFYQFVHKNYNQNVIYSNNNWQGMIEVWDGNNIGKANAI